MHAAPRITASRKNLRCAAKKSLTDPQRGWVRMTHASWKPRAWTALLSLAMALPGCTDDVVYKDLPDFDPPPEGAAGFLGFSDVDGETDHVRELPFGETGGLAEHGPFAGMGRPGAQRGAGEGVRSLPFRLTQGERLHRCYGGLCRDPERAVRERAVRVVPRSRPDPRHEPGHRRATSPWLRSPWARR